MASEGPVMNGDISRSPGQTAALEDTLQQMNNLIQENRDLKEALHQTNVSMKERFEGLAAWKEKQKEERNFLESKLTEAKVRIESLMAENQDLRKKLETQGGEAQVAQSPELEALHAHVARLQAEKNDLVALNSELQLKADHSSNDDSFIEIIKVTVSSFTYTPRCPSVNLTMSTSRLEQEDLTVSQLLQSLRDETQRAERLQDELLKLSNTLKELEKKSDIEQSTQTSEPEEIRQQAAKVLPQKTTEFNLLIEFADAASEVENLKTQGMKKNLTDRCREVEQDVATLKAQLVEKQTVQSENDRLKLQLDSMQAQSLVEQRKAGEERTNFAKLKEAYTKLFEDYDEMKRRGKSERLKAAEEALAAKQERMDEMKHDLYEKEKELETVNVFKVQAEVYSSDFHAERAAREKIHEEKERLATQLEFVRQSLTEMQRRHGGASQPSLLSGSRATSPDHACPKCNEILPDLDSLQIHIMDCIN
uniref:Optineurin n=1 Tax=Neogobius melanostomus TaxID=47308 RepID=A0A8C6UDQ0_9GOBI